MNTPPQPDSVAFLPAFFCRLFAPDDRVGVSCIPPPDNRSLLRDNAVRILVGEWRNTPNVYFRASAHDGSATYAKHNCTRTRGLFLDLDYGGIGHRKPSPFRTLDDAVGYLRTMPLRPSIAWHTGHGVQACFVLDTPFLFPAGGGAPGSLERYEAVSKRLSAMAMSDSTFTPEHLFRVPLTWNCKSHMDATIPDVCGELLWSDGPAYRFEDIEQACLRYGVEDLPLTGEGDTPDVPEPVPDAPYAALPEDLRLEIERQHAERSDTMFGIVLRMVGEGYSDAVIQDAIAHGPDFREKYRKSLGKEVERCLSKIRGERYVYARDSSPPITVPNTPVPVSLSDCAPLPPALDAMLQKYAAVTGAALLPRVFDAARFHTHVFESHSAGVLESPCGSGKSTWALCRIALHAAPGNRYVYVTETVDALHAAADVLEKLTDVPVGRVHGFSADRCQALCGVKREWYECGRRQKRSACLECAAKEKCSFYNRDAEQQKPILCMTHAGLIRALEDDAPVLQDACILVDESLSPFSTWEVTEADLHSLERHAGARTLELGKLLPCSHYACRSDLALQGIGPEADTFARRNYVFRDERETAALRSVYDTLRTCIRSGLSEPDAFHPKPGEGERARDTLAALLNFFRPTIAADATYAFHETQQGSAVRYTLTRNRFTLDTQRPYKKLFVLNASAQLSPYPYPDNMPVYACPDLPDTSHLVTLHVVRGNPTRTRQQQNILLSEFILRVGPNMSGHTRILVATDKGAGSLDDVKEQIHATLGTAVEIVHLTRGRIRGLNTAGACTLAYLTSMSTFTTLDDCALHAALLLRRTFPDRPYVYSAIGAPNMHGGRFYLPAMRTIFALRSLDELYQAIWRTAVRNDQPVDVVIAVPDPHWIVALWRTVMPHANIGITYRAKDNAIALPAQAVGLTATFTFEEDGEMSGLRLVCSPPGTEFTKQQIAKEFGYSGAQAWKTNAHHILALLGPFFEEGTDSSILRRRGAPGG